MATSLSQNGTAIHFSDAPSHELLVGTEGGVFTVRRENSKDWHIARKSLEDCHVCAVMIEPSSGLIFAGTRKQSVYASADSGKTWELRDRGLTQKDIWSLSFNKIHGNVKLYAGTEPAHLFESDDLGDMWHELPSVRSVPSVTHWDFPPPPHIAHVKNVAFHPQDARTIYVSIEQGALLRSRDGGLSWEELDGFYKDVHRLVIRPSDPNCFYITGGDGLYYSGDGGKSWEHLTTRSMRVGYPDPFLIHPFKEEIVYMAGALAPPNHWRVNGTADSKIARSRDAGRTWEMLQDGLPEHIRGGIEAMTMEVWNGSFSLFAGTTDGEVFSSDDEGDHWTKIIDGLPPISNGTNYLNLKR